MISRIDGSTNYHELAGTLEDLNDPSGLRESVV